LKFKADDRIYRVLFGSGQASVATWSFGRSYGVAAAVLGSAATVSALGVAFKDLTGKAVDFAGNLGRKFFPRAAAFIRTRWPARLRLRNPPHPSQRLLPWIATIPALVLVTAWSSWVASPEARVSAFLLALFATSLAVLVHEAGHLLAALWAHARVKPVAWGPGIGMALLLMPFRLSSGPYVGHQITAPRAGRAWWVYLAGPSANLAVALAAYSLYLVRPLPLLQLIAQVQLAAVAFSLLPFRPMDGAPLARRRPLVMVAAGLIVAAAGTAMAVGTL
jgi:hypothetical protein